MSWALRAVSRLVASDMIVLLRRTADSMALEAESTIITEVIRIEPAVMVRVTADTGTRWSCVDAAVARAVLMEARVLEL